MKLTPHQERIVDEIIAERVFDIPSYLKAFSLGTYQRYNQDKIQRNFEKCESGQKYLFKKHGGLFYTEVYDSSGALLSRSPILNQFTYELNENPISSPLIAEVEMKIKGETVLYNGKTYHIDFLAQQHLVADSFNNIKEFILLWSYLKREALIIEVDKECSKEDITPFFELVKQPLQPEEYPKWKVIHDTIPASTKDKLEKLITSFVPQKNAQGYIDQVWKVNIEHFTTCHEFIGKKILSTPSLEIFQKDNYCTFEEVSQKKNSLVAWIAVWISVISVVLGNILPLFTKQDVDYLEDIYIEISDIHQYITSDASHQVILDSLLDIKEILANISTENTSTEYINAINNLSTRIDELSIILDEPESTETSVE